MPWSSRLTLTIDEFSLLMVAIDPAEVCGFIHNPIDELGGSLEAFSWRELVIEALITGAFANDDCRIYVGGVIGGVSQVSLDTVDFDSNIRTDKTRILTKSLLNWVESLGYKIPTMLTPPSPSHEESKNSSHIDDRWIEIEQLLDGKHEHSAVELKTAILCWLGISDLYKKKCESFSTVKQDADAWLEEKAEELTDTQKKRIAYVVNWKKEGGRPSKDT